MAQVWGHRTRGRRAGREARAEAVGAPFLAEAAACTTGAAVGRADRRVRRDRRWAVALVLVFGVGSIGAASACSPGSAVAAPAAAPGGSTPAGTSAVVAPRREGPPLRRGASAASQSRAAASALVGQRRASTAVVRAEQSRWLVPVWPSRIVRPFRNPPQDWLPGHRGVDLRGAPGEPVRAAGAGRVRFAGILAGRGVVVVDHGQLRTTYEPVEPLVLPGQHVGRGALLGVIAPGTGHCGTGTCLHLGLKRGRAYLDPRLLFGDPEALLRPW